jgi:hypothetical protein
VARPIHSVSTLLALAHHLRSLIMPLQAPSTKFSLIAVVTLALTGVVVISVSWASRPTTTRRRRTAAVADHVEIVNHNDSDSEARRFESHPFWSCSDVVLTAISFMDVSDAIALAFVSGLPVHLCSKF